MKLSAPKQIVFCISVILIVLGLILVFVPATYTIVLIKGSGFTLGYLLTLVGSVLLVLGNLLKGF